METIADFEKWIGTMRSELGQHVIALEKLSVAFVESDIQLIRHDQVVRLRILKARIMSEVEKSSKWSQQHKWGLLKEPLFGGAAAFISGSLYTAATRHKDAYKTGVKLAGSVLSKKVPFGMVLIGIGKEGLPEDIKSIPVSRFARESTKTEPEVETSWKHDGYLLVTPEQFAELLDKVESGVLDGSASLPMAVDEVIKRIA